MLDNLKTVLAVLALLPQLIDALELAIPQAKQGAAKLDLAKQIVLETVAGATAVWPLVERAIAAMVAARKRAPQPPPAGGGGA